MTNTTLGLILITPLVWFLIGNFLDKHIEEWKESIALTALFITLALWGVYFLLGGKL